MSYVCVITQLTGSQSNQVNPVEKLGLVPHENLLTVKCSTRRFSMHCRDPPNNAKYTAASAVQGKNQWVCESASWGTGVGVAWGGVGWRGVSRRGGDWLASSPAQARRSYTPSPEAVAFNDAAYDAYFIACFPPAIVARNGRCKQQQP